MGTCKMKGWKIGRWEDFSHPPIASQTLPRFAFLSFPQAGRCGFQPHRNLYANRVCPKIFFSPVGFICLGVSAAYLSYHTDLRACCVEICASHSCHVGFSPSVTTTSGTLPPASALFFTNSAASRCSAVKSARSGVGK